MKKRGSKKRQAKKSVRLKAARRPARSNSTKKAATKTGRSLLGVTYSTSTKKVTGRNGKTWNYNATKFRPKEATRKSLKSKAFKQNLVEKVKEFRKKHNTRKTRIHFKFKVRAKGSKGKWKEKSISIARADNLPGAEKLVDRSMERFAEILRGYASKQGIQIGALTEIVLERITKAKSRKKNSAKRVRK